MTNRTIGVINTVRLLPFLIDSFYFIFDDLKPSAL